MAKAHNKGFYANVLSAWHKALGPMPTEAQLATAHVFARPGKQALGLAQALRDQGVSLAQMTGAAALFDGKPTTCRNKMIGSGGLVQAGLFRREPMPGVIKLSITPVGQKWVDRAADAAKARPEPKANGKPAKPAGKPAKAGKPASKRKPRPAPVTEPVTVPVTVPVTGQPDQLQA